MGEPKMKKKKKKELLGVMQNLWNVWGFSCSLLFKFWFPVGYLSGFSAFS